MNYVLYHSNCYDGFGAAYSAWKALGDEGVKYIPVGYGYPPPDMPDAEQIFIVDFSYPSDELLKLVTSQRHISVFVLDHHKTAQAALEPMKGKYADLYITFDMERSGAGITWDYFHPDTPRPKLINHIEDRDLWRFKMEGSREVHAALVSHPFDFKMWDAFDVDKLIIEGGALVRQYRQLVDNICKKPFMVKIGEYTVPAVNTSIAWSEVGEKLGDLYPDAPFVASFTEFDDISMWSLRTSKNNRNFDVSAVAKQFGGGGHAAAAGFKVSRSAPIEVK